MPTPNTFLAVIVAAVAAAAAADAGAQQSGAERERCYGISMAGANDCASTGNNSCAGTAKADHDRGAWKYVAKGTCTAIEVTLKDGRKRMGSLQPIRG